jgi:hypothetical protein
MSRYCRGVDVLAFIACTALCLAHVFARKQGGQDPRHSRNVLSSLIHHRASDRGLMERTLESMEKAILEDGDDICNAIANVLRPLLGAEKANAEGEPAHSNLNLVSEFGGQGKGFGGGVDYVNQSISITLPFVATFKLHIGEPLNVGGMMNAPFMETGGRELRPGTGHGSDLDYTSSLWPTDHSTRRSLDFPLQGGFLPQAGSSETGPADVGGEILNSDYSNFADLPPLGGTSPLHGVDLALFDSLFSKAGT